MCIDRRYIRKELERFTEVSAASESRRNPLEPATESTLFQDGVSSQQAERLLRGESGGIRSKAIRFFFMHKERLKHIPVLGKLLVRQKDRMLFKSLDYQHGDSIDLSDCIGWYRDDFIVECYWRLLGRAPDHEGFHAYVNLSILGADNRVIAYALIRSEEFAKRVHVQSEKEYRKAYNRFFRRLRLKRIPILGHIVSLLAVPGQIERLYVRVERGEQVVSAQAERLAGMVATLQASVSVLQNQLQSGQYVREEFGKVRKVLFEIQLQLENANDVKQSVEELQEEIGSLRGECARQASLRVVTDALETQATASAALSEKLDGQAKILTANLEKLDSQAWALAAHSEKLDGVKQSVEELQEEIGSLRGECARQASLRVVTDALETQATASAALSEKLDGQAKILTANSEKLDGQAVISTVLSEKLDELPQFIHAVNVSSHTAMTGIPSGVIAVLVDGFIMGVPAEEWGFAMFLSQTGHFEPKSERFFESLLHPDMRVLDLGANLGIYTLRALRAGCTVFSYEPTPRTCKLLKQNIKASGFAECGRIHIKQMAVSDRCEMVEFYENSAMCGHNSMFGEADQQAITVPAVTLDSQRDLLGPVDVIKMDIEGAEYFALCGMKQLLRENPGVQMLMEFAPAHIERAGIEPMVLLELVHEFGFSIYLIDEDTGEIGSVSDERLLQMDSVNLYLKREG